MTLAPFGLDDVDGLMLTVSASRHSSGSNALCSRNWSSANGCAAATSIGSAARAAVATDATPNDDATATRVAVAQRTNDVSRITCRCYPAVGRPELAGQSVTESAPVIEPAGGSVDAWFLTPIAMVHVAATPAAPLWHIDVSAVGKGPHCAPSAGAPGVQVCVTVAPAPATEATRIPTSCAAIAVPQAETLSP